MYLVIHNDPLIQTLIKSIHGEGRLLHGWPCTLECLWLCPVCNSLPALELVREDELLVSQPVLLDQMSTDGGRLTISALPSMPVPSANNGEMLDGELSRANEDLTCKGDRLHNLHPLGAHTGVLRPKQLQQYLASIWSSPA